MFSSLIHCDPRVSKRGAGFALCLAVGPPQPQGGGRSRLQFAGASYLVPLIPQEPWRRLGQPIGISFSRWESEQLEIAHQPSTLVDEPKLRRFHTSSHPKAHSPNPKSGVCHRPWDRDTVRGAHYALKQSAGDHWPSFPAPFQSSGRSHVESKPSKSVPPALEARARIMLLSPQRRRRGEALGLRGSRELGSASDPDVESSEGPALVHVHSAALPAARPLSTMS